MSRLNFVKQALGVHHPVRGRFRCESTRESAGRLSGRARRTCRIARTVSVHRTFPDRMRTDTGTGDLAAVMP